METFEEHYSAMRAAIIKHMPGADMALVDRAVDYANEKHKLQKRKDGSPYIIHPLAVAEIVAEMGLDTDAVLGAILHDCIEDTDASHDDIATLFNPTVVKSVRVSLVTPSTSSATVVPKIFSMSSWEASVSSMQSWSSAPSTASMSRPISATI